jgi:hypothetical protein
MSQLHASGQKCATNAGRVTNHNQKMKGIVANSNDTNTTVSFDGMAK